MVDFSLYGELSFTGDFTWVVDHEFWEFGTVPGRFGFLYIGISATTLGHMCTLLNGRCALVWGVLGYCHFGRVHRCVGVTSVVAEE